MILSLYIAGRRRICAPVTEAALVRGLSAIRERMPELEIQGRVRVTTEENGVVRFVQLQQE